VRPARAHGEDLADLEAGLDVGVDFVALSFVREAKDIQQLRKIVSGAAHKPLIIAKIEDQLAVKNFDESCAKPTASWWRAAISHRVSLRGTAHHPAAHRQSLPARGPARDRRHAHAGEHD